MKSAICAIPFTMNLIKEPKPVLTDKQSRKIANALVASNDTINANAKAEENTCTTTSKNSYIRFYQC